MSSDVTVERRHREAVVSAAERWLGESVRGVMRTWLETGEWHGEDRMHLRMLESFAQVVAKAEADAVAPWEALLNRSRDTDPEHAGNGATFEFTHEGDDFAPNVASVWFSDGSLAGEGPTATAAARALCEQLGINIGGEP